MTKARLRIPQDTEIICPDCGETVGYFAQDLFVGEVVKPYHLTVEMKKDKNRQLRVIECQACGGSASGAGRGIFTQDGWM